MCGGVQNCETTVKADLDDNVKLTVDRYRQELYKNITKAKRDKSAAIKRKQSSPQQPQGVGA